MTKGSPWASLRGWKHPSRSHLAKDTHMHLVAASYSCR